MWSSFVWRNELADTFVESVAVPWFVSAVSGTAALNAWLRSLGASVGRGVWCETYWLPEADLVRLGDGVAVNRGCVLQTHLFHDRIMSMDTVTLDAGATLGPQQRDPAGRVDRRRRHGRPRVAGAARRDDPAGDDLDRQPHRTLAGARVNLGRAEHADPYLPGHGSLAWSVAHYDLELDYRVAGNRLDARARLRVVAAEPLSRISLDLAHLRVSKVSATGAGSRGSGTAAASCT